MYLLIDRFHNDSSEYTQIVWAQTTVIGCGQITFRARLPYGYHYFGQILVCNYGPAGNIENQTVYGRY